MYMYMYYILQLNTTRIAYTMKIIQFHKQHLKFCKHCCNVYFEGRREQLNSVTSYIDASNVYGSTTKEAIALREMQEGKYESFRA